MRQRGTPTPSKSSTMVKEYLEIIDSRQRINQRAKKFDIYRRAGSEAQTIRMIKYLKEKANLIEGNDKIGYIKTKKGEELFEILKKRDLVGILTRDLSGRRIGR